MYTSRVDKLSAAAPAAAAVAAAPAAAPAPAAAANIFVMLVVSIITFINVELYCEHTKTARGTSQQTFKNQL